MARINYRTCVPMRYLRDGKLGTVPILERDKYFFDEAMPFYLGHWKANLEDFRRNTYIVSDGYFAAAEKAKMSLVELLKDLMMDSEEAFHVCGTFVLSDSVAMLSCRTVVGSEAMDLVYYLFDKKKGYPLAMYVDSSREKVYQTGWMSQIFEKKSGDADTKSWFDMRIAMLMMVDVFRRYAKVELVEVSANSRVKEMGKKYLNETDGDVVYLDSMWFRELVRSEGFGVRGHFRLQPKKKEGVWTRELIWISDFKKEGYRRRSGKELSGLK